jgi:hypothetical protein
MSDEEGSDLERLRAISKQLRTQFSDFVLLVRTKDGSPGFAQTNEDYSWGACERHVQRLKDRAMINTMNEEAGKDGKGE